MFHCFESDEKQRARSIIRHVDKHSKKKIEVIKNAAQILMLGTGASGKTTFIKQMKILRSQGFNQKEKESYIKKIYQDINSACWYLYAVSGDAAMSVVADVTKRGLSKVYDQLGESSQQPTTDELRELCELIQADAKLLNLINTRSIYKFPDSAPYFLDPANYVRILSPQYLPNEQDILYSRTPTTGVAHHIFEVRGKGKLRVSDVGGQKCERTKWITLLDYADFIMFVVDASAYDNEAEDNPEINSLQEAIMLLAGISNFQVLSRAGFLVFFNKTDLLESKLKRVKFSSYFSNYTGDNNYESVKDFLQSLAKEVSPSKEQTMYIYFTVATDSKNFEHVLQAVLDKIYMENVAQYTN